MRNVNYKVSFVYTINDNDRCFKENGELSETTMSKENVVRLLCMLSPLEFRNNLTNFTRLNRKGEYMVVSMIEGNMKDNVRKFLKITR